MIRITRLFDPIDSASLVVFRIVFGLIMLIEVFRYWLSGWIERYYQTPEFLFKYYGFGWVQPWPGDGMYWHFAVLGVLAVMIAAGALYRIATVLFFIGFSYIFLLDQARYLNHFYMVMLISLLMCLIPAHRNFSVDAWLWPRWRQRTVPAWTVWSLRLQLEIIYLYAGLVKINSDWLHGEPLSMWLARRADYPVMGWFFSQDWAVLIGAYGVIALHLIGAPLLLWRRTRLVVFVIYSLFHLCNAWVFNIGIFPWLTLAATLLFFDPDWPRQLWRRLTGQPGTSVAAQPAGYRFRPVIVTVLAGWFAVQILFPLRHWLYPGNVSWTEQGHRFAWQMKLRDKAATALFYVTDPVSGRIWRVSPKQYLTGKQVRTMAGRPDMILQFAHYLADQWRQRGFKDVEVRASVKASLNGRPFETLIDPKRDLAAVERDLWSADWILPLTVPLDGNRRIGSGDSDD